jgi:hypothetical protein
LMMNSVKTSRTYLNNPRTCSYIAIKLSGVAGSWIDLPSSTARIPNT